MTLIPFPRTFEPGAGAPLVVGDRLVLSEPPAEFAGVIGLVTEILRHEGIALSQPEPGDTGALPRLRLDHRADDSDPESYTLSVDEHGASIAATTAAGVFYAAQTLVQLLETSRDGEVHIPALHIRDGPRFRYRAAMLDVARHFFSVDTVKAFIDRLVLVKLNHLHLHLSDDQGWRLQIHSWPRLTDGDGTGTPEFYTQADYSEIVAYAAERFVTVVPEMDLPGHTHAAIVAYPELAPAGYTGAPGALDRDATGGASRRFASYSGWEVGFSTVDTRSEVVHRFVADVAREVASLTPGPYLHLGGDESLSTPEDDYLAFLARASATAASTGKTLVFWHDAGASAELPRGTVGQYWDFVAPRGRAAELTRRFAENDGHVIFSPADAIYLDMKHATGDALGLDWADGPTSLQAAYSWEPGEVIDGLDESRILGVEAPLWSETIDALAGIDALAFPRLLAAAEIAWSPPPAESAERTWASFGRRVAAWQARLSARGISFTRAEGIEWS